ncbi:MAG TPA: prenyltransferase/squalene oxidase repeat-containing protein [Phycisphaerae bacterium]|nr:prenyltransferase/squalene oxidase repeat-containing protein [Phycisphaerae bacterium]HUT60536.1 prenyltransferase/squalene oxidase repeat-containing protein [Phycisphaerae bacterium]
MARKRLAYMLIVAMVALPMRTSLGQAEQAQTPAGPPTADALKAARDKGLDWLAKNQAADGSWGGEYSIAVTSFACLSYMASADEPFAGERGKALVRGLSYIVGKQTDGVFVQQGHTWIHVQGFATLALSEAYGRSLLCKTKPDMDTGKLKAVITKAVKAIQDNQSNSGGWWYTRGSKAQHEGSTTVTAVQALVSAANFGIAIDAKVLERGFEYLKKCQNDDGGFDYKLGDTISMKEGTAADVATLALMKKFDYRVMVNGYKFLIKLTPPGISKERFPYYGHFYGCMGMRLLGEELRSYRKNTDAYIAGAQKDLLSWQKADGSWPLKRWIVQSAKETPAYSTAFAALILSVPEARLSIFNRKPPTLPDAIVD